MFSARARVALLSFALLACSGRARTGKTNDERPSSAHAFVQEVDARLRTLSVAASRADWQRSTDITEAHERLSAEASEQVMAYASDAIRRSFSIDERALDGRDARMLQLLRRGLSLPAPNDPAQRAELSALAARMESVYGSAQYCREPASCRDVDTLNEVLQKSRDPAELLDAWQGWHQVGAQLRPMFERYVTLANVGARDLGFRDVGDIWLSRYDMTPDAFRADVERLWQQVRPLYEQLHCYTRKKLHARHGALVPSDGPIPAHLLGNMWAQEWTALYPDLEPYPGHGEQNVTRALVEQGYDEARMVKLGESFFTSVGFAPLPETFWQRSLLKKPQDRAVVCHASAWDVTFAGDLRIKMCVRITHEDLITIHHELGHVFYFAQYNQLPFLLQEGANDGFHEAVGDAVALSITPGYLRQVGLLPASNDSPESALNQLLFHALDKVAFLPFARLVDEWRLRVFSGQISPARYNASWWELRAAYQGVETPTPRREADFDPGAKYHVAANVPYTRYFLATILQYQFHRAMCRVAGFHGPLHACSVHGDRSVGDKLKEMLALGAQVPWPDALFTLTGERALDASALLDYYAPLAAWLVRQNADQQCGWQGVGATSARAPSSAEKSR